MGSDEMLKVGLDYRALVWLGWVCANVTVPTQALRLDEIRTHKWNILRCSAMTGENLKEGLAWVVEDAKARLFLY